jgi:RNA-directed DNA polymerase
MNDPQKSDCREVARRPANASEGSGGESVERRRQAEGNPSETHTCRTQSRIGVSQGLERVQERARQNRKERFTALLHHIDVERLKAAYFALKRKAAPGVDGLTWAQYGEGLEDKLVELHRRVHRGGYRPLPSRRTYIGKDDGRKRPLGVATINSNYTFTQCALGMGEG